MGSIVTITQLQNQTDATQCSEVRTLPQAYTWDSYATNFRLPVSQRRMEARPSMINTVVNGLKELPSYFIKKAGRRNEYGANPFFRPVDANSCGA